MQTELKIEFDDVVVQPDVRAAISRHVAQLEVLFGRITSCRVAVHGPGKHHKQGGPYGVHVHLALPDGRDVSITRTPDPTGANPILSSRLTMPSGARVANYGTRPA